MSAGQGLARLARMGGVRRLTAIAAPALLLVVLAASHIAQARGPLMSYVPGQDEFDLYRGVRGMNAAPAPPLALPSSTLSTRATITSFSMQTQSFRVGKGSGDAFLYSLSEAATVRIDILQRRPGRSAGGKCKKPSPRLRKKRRCRRSVPAGSITEHAAAGSNTTSFSGRIGKRALKPGAYVAKITAGNVKSTSFTILGRPNPSPSPRHGGRENYRGKSDQGEQVYLSTEGHRLVLFNSIVRADCPNGGPPFPVAVYVGAHPDYPHELLLHGDSFEISDYNRPGNTQVFSLKGHVGGGTASGTFSGHLNDPEYACASSTVHWTASRSR
jgi:hypothetical protein